MRWAAAECDQLLPSGFGVSAGSAALAAGARRHQLQLQEVQRCDATTRDGLQREISACDKGQQWEPALDLLAGFWRSQMEANVIGYSATISACDNGQQREQEVRRPRLCAEYNQLQRGFTFFA